MKGQGLHVDFYPTKRTPLSTELHSYGPAKRKVSIWRWRILLFLVFLPLLGMVLSLLQAYMFVRADGKVLSDAVQVRANNAGTISAVYVSVGQAVHRGTPLFEMSLSAADQKRRAIMTQELHDVRSSQGQTTIVSTPLVSPETLANEKAILEQAEKDASQMRTLVAENAATANELTQLEDRVANARLAYEHDQQQPIRSASKDQGGLEASLVSQLRLLDAQRGVVRAPLDGIITEIQEPAGGTVLSGDPEMSIAKAGSQHILAEVDLANIEFTRIGTPAEIIIAGHAPIQARVTGIPAAVRSQSGDSGLDGRRETIAVQLELAEHLNSDVRLDGYPVKVRFRRFSTLPYL